MTRARASYNEVGQLGVNDTNNRGNDTGQMGDALPFVSLGGGLNATALAAGFRHVCAIVSGGMVACWGCDSTFAHQSFNTK